MENGSTRGTLLKIAVLVEGKTEERFFREILVPFLRPHFKGDPPQVKTFSDGGRIPTHDKLRRAVEYHLQKWDHVIALTDVYTGSNPRAFSDAADAKAKMKQWVGTNQRFHPHAAQYDFEAWLLPYWPVIQKKAGHNQSSPGSNPELVNHGNPPAHRIMEIFELGTRRASYQKPRDAVAILEKADLSIAISQCKELKALANTILRLSENPPLP